MQQRPPGLVKGVAIADRGGAQGVRRVLLKASAHRREVKPALPHLVQDPDLNQGPHQPVQRGGIRAHQRRQLLAAPGAIPQPVGQPQPGRHVDQLAGVVTPDHLTERPAGGLVIRVDSILASSHVLCFPLHSPLAT